MKPWIWLALVLTAAPVSAQSLMATTPVAARSTITVSVSNATGPTNWVGFYAAGADDGYYLQWQYLNGQQTPPATPVINTTLQFIAPDTPGHYEIRLFTPLRAETAPVSVGISDDPPNDGSRIVFNGDSISAPSGVTGSQNWTAIVATQLGFQTTVNLATNGKYAVGVLNEAPLMSGALCVVMIGANDMAASVTYNVPADTARAEYLATMRQVIAALRSSCVKVAVLSQALTMHPREVLRYGAWVDGLRMLCVEFGATFLDLYRYMADLSAIKSASVVDSWYLSPGADLYHLSPAGHAMIADFVVRSGKLTP